MILEHLHPLLKIDDDGLKHSSRKMDDLPASASQIERLRRSVPQVDGDYVDIVRSIDGVRLEYKKDGHYIFDIYILGVTEAAVYASEWYPFLARALPGCFFFGQADAWSYFVGQDQGRHGVYRIEPSVPLWEYAKYIAPSIRALLCDGVGWPEED